MAVHDGLAGGASGSCKCGGTLMVAVCVGMFMFGRWSAVEEIDREKVTGAVTRIRLDTFGGDQADAQLSRAPAMQPPGAQVTLGRGHECTRSLRNARFLHCVVAFCTCAWAIACFP